MAILQPGILAEFVRITKYPIKTYFKKYIDFSDNHSKNIYDYYGGKIKKPNATSFKLLDQLLQDSQLIENLIESKRNSFKTGAIWDLAELLSDLFIALETTSNASKWLRSAIAKNDFTPGVEVEYILQQLQTLEAVSSDVVGSSDRDNDWVTIALRNDIREEDYDMYGGNRLVISGKNNATIKLRSVVDNISGEKVYGIDLHRKLQFINDDLMALSYKETMQQTVDVLAGLTRGTTPEFPSDGYTVNAGNRKNMAFPVLIRQLTQTFRKDDTLKSMGIKNIEIIEDALFLSFTVTTRLGDLFQTQTTI